MPIIGITCDTVRSAKTSTMCLTRTYAESVTKAGGTPILLPSIIDKINDYLSIIDGLLLTGGDDPNMDMWDIDMHPSATPMCRHRQYSEMALLNAATEISMPILGICLGMQLMTLHAGGSIDQHMPESMGKQAAAYHRHPEGITSHGILYTEKSVLFTGDMSKDYQVASHHKQRMISPGHLSITALAKDGTIEAVHNPNARFFAGVQWHPERTETKETGADIFERFVLACK